MIFPDHIVPPRPVRVIKDDCSSTRFIRSVCQPGWQINCPGCVASKFTCDEHYKDFLRLNPQGGK